MLLRARPSKPSGSSKPIRGGRKRFAGGGSPTSTRCRSTRGRPGTGPSSRAGHPHRPSGGVPAWRADRQRIRPTDRGGRRRRGPGRQAGRRCRGPRRAAVPADPGRYDLPSVGAARHVASLEITQPDGPGFTVEGNLIRWQNWNLRVSLHPLEGLVLHQVTWNERDGTPRPVLHRASLSDMVVPYGSTDPAHRWKKRVRRRRVGHGPVREQPRAGVRLPGRDPLPRRRGGRRERGGGDPPQRHLPPRGGRRDPLGTTT